MFSISRIIFRFDYFLSLRLLSVKRFAISAFAVALCVLKKNLMQIWVDLSKWKSIPIFMFFIQLIKSWFHLWILLEYALILGFTCLHWFIDRFSIWYFISWLSISYSFPQKAWLSIWLIRMLLWYCLLRWISFSWDLLLLLT